MRAAVLVTTLDDKFVLLPPDGLLPPQLDHSDALSVLLIFPSHPHHQRLA